LHRIGAICSLSGQAKDSDMLRQCIIIKQVVIQRHVTDHKPEDGVGASVSTRQELHFVFIV